MRLHLHRGRHLGRHGPVRHLDGLLRRDRVLLDVRCDSASCPEWGVILLHRLLDEDHPDGLRPLRDVGRPHRLRGVGRPRQRLDADRCARHRDVLGEACPGMERRGCFRDGGHLSGRRRRALNGACPVRVRKGCCRDVVRRGELHRDARLEPAPRLALEPDGRLAWLPTNRPALQVPLLVPLPEPAVPRLLARGMLPEFPGVPAPVPSAREQPVWLPSARKGWERWAWILVVLPALVRPWLVPRLLAWLQLVHPGMRREVSSRRVPQWLMRRNGRIRPVPAVWLLHLSK